MTGFIFLAALAVSAIAFGVALILYAVSMASEHDFAPCLFHGCVYILFGSLLMMGIS